jgi:hypothetical protein
VASLDRQREEPRRGLDVLKARYPDVDTEAAVEGWHLAEPNIFGADPIGGMDADRWRQTVAHVARARSLRELDPLTVYRPEFAAEQSASVVHATV